MKTDFFIDRPIFSAVISMVIVIVGVVGLVNLPIDQYPRIVPPIVRVSASYPGASAQAVSQAVATPIEQELNGTPGMLYMESSNSNSGAYSLDLTFDIDCNPDLAAVEVQNRVKEAEARLPAEVVQNGISVEKQSSNTLMTITLQSDDEKYDEIYLSNFATLNVVDMLRRVPGVGKVSSVGGRYYAMQIWVQPDKMASLGISVKDIQNALKDQNRESAAGVIGQQPAKDIDVTIPISAIGRLSSVTEFEDIIIRASDDGSIVRLKDVARISLEAQSYNTESGINGENTAVLNINMLPGENAVNVAKLVRKEMKEISKSFPDGISYNIPFDMTTYISASVKEVYKTLFEALILVLLVVFLALQNWRATLIPSVAVPISLIGTFGVMLALGYTLNMMTLLGLILAIGIVVDDAIVVVENVDRIMKVENLDARQATKKAMRETAGALVAMSLVLCAVLIPVSFLSGITGQVFRQFTLTIAVSVLISTVVALTLSPAMCALLLRNDDADKKHRIFAFIDKLIDSSRGVYLKIVCRTINERKRMFTFWGIACIGVYLMGVLLPKGFIPKEDQGYFTVELELPVSATLERTRLVSERAVKHLMSYQEVEYVMNVDGSSPRVGSTQSSSTLTVILKPWHKRKHKDMEYLMEKIGKEFSQYPECRYSITTPSVIPGLGTGNGFTAVLEAKNGCDYDELRAAADTLVYYASRHPDIGSVSLEMQDDIPQLFFNADRDKTQLLGVPLSDVFSTLKAYTGSVYINDFNMYNRIYRVYMQADAEYRSRVEDINLYSVRSASGQMVPVTALGTTAYTTGPGTIKRFNMFTSAVISGNPASGASSGQAMEAIEDIVSEHLPDNIGLQWSGISYQEKQESGKTFLFIALCLLFVFLILSALYESWLIPAAVILSLPIAILGAFVGSAMSGLDNNMYFQIGLVVLIGLVAKNAILIVEYAKKEMENGRSAVDAAVEAAGLRFRPVLMTALSFILGMLPLVFAGGPGSASRVNIGTGVFWGMLVGVTLGLVFVPFFFAVVNRKRTCRFRLWKPFGKIGSGLCLLLLIGVSASSCSPARYCKASQIDMPDSFGQEQVLDSTSIADASWWEFYQDAMLRALIDSALTNNKDVESARYKMEEYRRKFNVARASRLPSINLNAAADNEYNNYGYAGGRNSPEYDLKLALNWELDLWGKNSWNKRGAEAEYLSASETARAIELELIASVAKAYFELIELDRNLVIVRKTLLTREQGTEQARLRYEGGLTSETAYQQSLVELASAKALIPDAEKKVKMKESELAFLIGSFPVRIERADDVEDIICSSNLPYGVPGSLLERRPDLMAAKRKLEAAEAAVGVAQASRFPQLSITLSGGLETDEIAGFLKSPFYYMLGSLAGPIFNFGRLKNNRDAAVAAYYSRRAEYEKTVLIAYREAYEAVLALESARENTEVKRSLENTSRKYVELSRLQYINGAISYLDVLDAQRRYLDAQLQLNDAETSEQLAVVALYKALGGGLSTGSSSSDQEVR